MIELYTAAPDGAVVPDPAQTMQFPAGEQHIKLADEVAEGPLAVVVRGAGAEDLVSAAMAISAAKHDGRRAELILPYLPGARQDRGRPLGARVYAEIVNSMRADGVHYIDVHSPAMVSFLHNPIAYPLARHIRSSLAHRAADTHITDYVGVIAPDAGAAGRAASAAKALGLPMFQAGKSRDFTTGKLSGFTCEELPETGRLLVVDDICDGGGTFAGLAQATGLGPDRLDLWVTHGVFSGRAPQLREHYGHIHTTDSHPGHTREDVGAIIHPIVPTLIREALS